MRQSNLNFKSQGSNLSNKFKRIRVCFAGPDYLRPQSFGDGRKEVEEEERVLSH